jgi:hypothetical protein
VTGKILRQLLLEDPLLFGLRLDLSVERRPIEAARDVDLGTRRRRAGVALADRLILIGRE